ncbi:alpha/beta hydrolase [Clostridium ihumii]|uniref:alpha/beta hydrolase n=1 Tax=Clostridium ihumii TaxID=1470356 RepID=UPI003D355CBA
MINKFIVKINSCFGQELDNLFLTHTPKSKSIVVIFPGSDGTCSDPILHYARKATLLSGCDVLSLEYGYYKANKTYEENFLKQIVFESKEVIKKCMDNSYENIFFISKSLGTVIAGEISKFIGYDKVDNLFLTPIIDTMQYMKNCKCDVIVGTNDKFFNKQYINEIEKYDLVNLYIIEDATHSLEIDNSYIKSLEILEYVTKLCAKFVRVKIKKYL